MMNKQAWRYSVLMVASIAAGVPTVSWTAELEEVTVTAQRRVESAQDVGISISQFSGEELQDLKITTVQSIAAQTPGVSVKNTFGEESPTFTFRGIGTNDASAINNQTVSSYVDGVSKPYNVMLGGTLFDLERVEILKGPQGTLYGSNNTGGAVNFITRKPEQASSAHARIDYGSYKTIDYEGALGGGLTDTLAGRIAVAGKERMTGFQRNRFFGGARNGEVQHYAGRGQLLWNATEDLDVLLTFHGEDHDDDNLNYVNISTQDPAFAFGGPPAVLCAPASIGKRNENQCTNFVGYSDPDGDDLVGDFNNSLSTRADGRLSSLYRGLGGALKIEWRLPRMTVVSLTAYDKFERDSKEDTDQGPALLLEAEFEDDIKSVTQELIVSSDDSWGFEWLAGINYHTDQDDGGVVLHMRDLLLTDTTNIYHQDVDAIAGFAHFGWQFAEAWKLGGGIRVTHETRKMDQVVIDDNTFGASLFTQPASFCAVLGICGIPGLGFDTLAPAPPTFGAAPLGLLDNRKLSVTDVSGEIAVDWTPMEDLLLYAKFSKGFKSGAFNGIVAFSQADLEPAKEEQVFAWEGGFKSMLLDRALQLNGAMFYMDWVDFQAQISASSPPGAFPLANAGDADIWGFELDVDYLPPFIEGLRMRAGMSYLNTKVTKSNPDLLVDLTGNDLHDAPEWAFNGLVSYTRPLIDGFNLILQSDFNWEDEKYFEAKNTPPIRQESYWLVNARIAVATTDDRWQVAFWSRNVFDETYFMDIFDFTETTGTGLGQVSFPREVGVSVNYRWE